MMRTHRLMFAFLALVVCATGVATPSFAALQTNVVERHYDRFGRPVGVSLNGERRTEIAYDDATGRIASMRVAGADEPFRWVYESGSDLKKTLHYPNGATVEWEYESNRDLVTLVSNDVYSSYRYEYDVAGRRVAKNDERYEYNARGELVLATNVVTGAAFAYRYDDIGNRQWSREFGTNCTYVANELNQYTNIVRGGVHELSAFDLDGNQTNVVTATGEWAVEYNGENRPVLWRRKSDGATICMAYDRLGRRVMKNDETFVYDGYLNISQTIWDPTEPVATRPLAMVVDGAVYLYVHDANKNVSDVVNARTGETAAHYDYSAFGRAIASTDSVVHSNPFMFSSEYADDVAGLICYNYRHYVPVLGRWLSRDPIEEIGCYHGYGLKGLLSKIEGESEKSNRNVSYSGGTDYLFLNNHLFQIDVLGLFGKYDPPPIYRQGPFPCCPSQSLDCQQTCRQFKGFSRALCDLNFFVAFRCRCVCSWQLLVSAKSGFPGYTRDVDCTYISPQGRHHTIGYYGKPTWFECPRSIELGCGQ